jgi:hypothetical protein
VNSTLAYGSRLRSFGRFHTVSGKIGKAARQPRGAECPPLPLRAYRLRPENQNAVHRQPDRTGRCTLPGTSGKPGKCIIINARPGIRPADRSARGLRLRLHRPLPPKENPADSPSRCSGRDSRQRQKPTAHSQTVAPVAPAERGTPGDLPGEGAVSKSARRPHRRGEARRADLSFPTREEIDQESEGWPSPPHISR